MSGGEGKLMGVCVQGYSWGEGVYVYFRPPKTRKNLYTSLSATPTFLYNPREVIFANFCCVCVGGGELHRCPP